MEQIADEKAFLEAPSLTKTIEETVMRFCDLKTAKNVNKEGNGFKLKNCIPIVVRLNIRRKQLASSALKS